MNKFYAIYMAKCVYAFHKMSCTVYYSLLMAESTTDSSVFRVLFNLNISVWC